MGNDMLREMGMRLFERRKQLRLTQEEIANRSDLAIQVVSNSELGKTAIRPENMIKLCMALEISADYLLTGQVSDKDVLLLDQRVRNLTPRQFRFMEDIIRNFVDLCEEGEVQQI